MFLKLTLSLLILLISSTGYCADWTADPDCLWALTMDETTGDFLDHCGSNNGDITPTGGDPNPPARTEGKFFGGADFNSSSGYFITMGDVTFMDGVGAFTFSIWLLNSEDYSSLERNIVRKDGAFNLQDSSAQERVYIWTSLEPLGHNFIVAADTYPTDYWISEDGNWHMYTVTYDGSTITGYRDCVEISDDPLTGTISNSANRFTLGRKPPEDGGLDYVYTGKMDDVIFLDRVLDTTECTDLMTNGIDGQAGHHPTMFKGYNIKLNKVKINGS